MSLNLKKSFFAAAILASLLYASCVKTSSSSPQTGDYTVTDIMKNSINATIFYKALVSSGMDTLLKGTGPFTVFVPTDSAFLASGITSTTIASVPAAVLQNLIEYQTIAGTAIPKAQFPAGPAARVIMSNGDSIFVTNNSNGFFVNGIPVQQSNIGASNGVIHALTQSALLPPKGNLMQLIASDTNFTYLVAAITRASTGSTNIQSFLASQTPYTLLAPLNSAFVKAGFATVSDINNANPDSLGNIILYHIVHLRLFTPDLVDGQPVMTTNDSSFQFKVVSNIWRVKGNANATNANLVNANIMARNGVLFIIDQLLQP